MVNPKNVAIESSPTSYFKHGHHAIVKAPEQKKCNAIAYIGTKGNSSNATNCIDVDIIPIDL